MDSKKHTPAETEEQKQEPTFIDFKQTKGDPDLSVLERKSVDQKTEVSLGIRIPTFGQILFGRGFRIESDSDHTTQLTDDGWRIKFQISF